MGIESTAHYHTNQYVVYVHVEYEYRLPMNSAHMCYSAVIFVHLVLFFCFAAWSESVFLVFGDIV